MIVPIATQEAGRFMETNIKKDYKKHQAKKRLTILFLALLTLMAVFWSINAGAIKISPIEIFEASLGRGEKKIVSVVRSIRLPRVVSGLIAGAGLSIAGAIMQNNLKNPLASPSTLGISNAAAFGANVAIILLGAGSISNSGIGEVQISNPYMVTICAMVFSLLATILIIGLSKLGSFTTQSIILAGVSLSSLFSAGTMIIQYFAKDSTKVAAVVFWTFGDLGRSTWKEVLIMGVIVLISTLYFIHHRWDYNALDSGEDTAKSLGVNVEKIRLISMGLSSIITAVTVSFLGVIGFIGLISPHITRRIIGSDNRFLLPASAIMGALILVVSDTLARIVISPSMLPVGAVTSFLGAPLFLYFLIKGDM
mgnify:CR=1 FL=1